MPAIGKRRAVSEIGILYAWLLMVTQGQEPPSSPPPTRRRRSPDSQSGVSDAPNLDGSENGADEADSQDQVVKKLVRLALSSEYSRVPLRRAEITSKGISTRFSPLYILADTHSHRVFRWQDLLPHSAHHHQ